MGQCLLFLAEGGEQPNGPDRADGGHRGLLRVAWKWCCTHWWLLAAGLVLWALGVLGDLWFQVFKISGRFLARGIGVIAGCSRLAHLTACV